MVLEVIQELREEDSGLGTSGLLRVEKKADRAEVEDDGGLGADRGSTTTGMLIEPGHGVVWEKGRGVVRGVVPEVVLRGVVPGVVLRGVVPEVVPGVVERGVVRVRPAILLPIPPIVFSLTDPCD